MAHGGHDRLSYAHIGAGKENDIEILKKAKQISHNWGKEDLEKGRANFPQQEDVAVILY